MQFIDRVKNSEKKKFQKQKGLRRYNANSLEVMRNLYNIYIGNYKKKFFIFINLIKQNISVIV